jgi:hypothetical protein
MPVQVPSLHEMRSEISDIPGPLLNPLINGRYNIFFKEL